MPMGQMFTQMNRDALARLEGRDPEDIARNAGIVYDRSEEAFHVSSMGMEIRVSWPECEITPSVSGWHRLLILHYLDLADGAPLTGREIPFSQMQSGMVRGGGIDRKWENALGQLPQLNERMLEEICKWIGGEKIPSNSDAAWRIAFLPRFPVMLKVWFADEDFPPSGRLLLDASADHYLTIEDAVTVAEILLEAVATPPHQRSFS